MPEFAARHPAVVVALTQKLMVMVTVSEPAEVAVGLRVRPLKTQLRPAVAGEANVPPVWAIATKLRVAPVDPVLPPPVRTQLAAVIGSKNAFTGPIVFPLAAVPLAKTLLFVASWAAPLPVATGFDTLKFSKVTFTLLQPVPSAEGV